MKAITVVASLLTHEEIDMFDWIERYVAEEAEMVAAHAAGLAPLPLYDEPDVQWDDGSDVQWDDGSDDT